MDPSTMIATRPQQGMALARTAMGDQSIEVRDTAAVAVAERAKAEIQAMCVMAIQRPRNLEDVRVRLLDHCKRPGFAAKARYAKPIGKGEAIEGPSIRFVETALQEYGNVMIDAVVTFEDDERMRVRVTVHDLERNVRPGGEAVITKRVERKFLSKGQTAISTRMNSYGEPVHLVAATDDDVLNKKGAAESKLIRNLGLRILPADLVDEAMEQCIATAESSIAKDPAGERRKIADAFHGIGVKPSQLSDYLGHALDAMQPAELLSLRQIYQSIRDGESTWSQVVESKREAEGATAAPAAPKGTAGIKSRLGKGKAGEPSAPAEPTLPLATPTSTPAVAPPPAEAPDDLSAHVANLRVRLERVGITGDLGDIVDAITRLPMGPDRVALEALAAKVAGDDEGEP